MTNDFSIKESTRLSLLALVFLLIAGCGDRPEQNRFTTPEEGTELPTSLFDELGDGSYSLARQAMEEEDWASAAEQLQILLSGPAPEATFANDLGYVQLQMGNLESALKALELAIEVDPAYQSAWFNRGMTLSRMNSPEEAIKAYLKAIELNDFYFEAWFNLGLVYYREGEFEASREAFLKVTDRTRSSRFNKAYYQLGLISAKLGDDAKAIKYYDESILLDPSHVPSYVNKGTALLRLDKLSKAEKLLRKGAALAPDNYRVHYNLGIVMRRMEKFEEARKSYLKAIELRPDSEKAWLNLGYVHAYLGDSTAAAGAFARALEIDPGYKAAQSAMDKLEAGKIQP